MRRSIRRAASELFQQSRDTPPVIVTEAHLIGLPEPVQRYLRGAHVVGKQAVRAVRLKQKGFFRRGLDQKWLPLVAEQYYTTQPPAFLWYGTIRPFPLVSISAKDVFSEGHGNMLVKLLSLVTLADARGPEADQGELVRYLTEIVWFPTAWLSDYIQWQAVGGRSAKATIRCQGATAAAVLHFNDKDELTQFTAERYREENGRYVLGQWLIHCGGYEEVNGVRIPLKGVAAWKLESGDFSYFRGEITEIEYDKPVVY